MDQAARLAIFNAQVVNVRALRVAIRQVRGAVNSALRENAEAQAQAFTKMYAILFCAWAEATFSKLIHTPHGFTLGEIGQIQRVKRENGVSAGWKKAVALGLRHLDAQRGSFTPNARQTLDRAIDQHIFDPSLMRNKLAHGQWVAALNRDNDALQGELTVKLAGLDLIKIESWRDAHDLLAEMVESLIESPKKAFMRDWFAYAERLEAKIIEAEKRTLSQHRANLKEKDIRTGARAKKHQAQ